VGFSLLSYYLRVFIRKNTTMEEQKGSAIAWIALIVSMLALVAAGTMLFMNMNKSEANNVSTTQNTSVNTTNAQEDTSVTNDEPATVNTSKSITEERSGISFTYPDGWLAKQHPGDENFCKEPVAMISFSNPEKNIGLTVGIRKVNDTATIWCRTGVGAGEPEAGEPLMILGTTMETTLLMFDGNAVEEFIGDGIGTSGNIVGDFEIAGYISSTETTQNSGKDIRDLADFAAARSILETIKISQ